MPDANVFLQCRALDELPFDTLGFSEGVRLVICRAVQREIDRLKSDGSPRRSKRARIASSIFRKVLREPTGIMQVSAGCALELMPPAIKPKFTGTLDPQNADDVLVAEAIAYKEANPGSKVFVLSGDSGLLATARHEGQDFADVPDNWLLPPEPTETDKRVQDLESRLRKYEASQPTVELQVVYGSTFLEEITVQRTRFAALTSIQLDELMHVVTTLRPIETTFNEVPSEAPSHPLIAQMTQAMASLMQYRPATPQEINEYREVAYPKWLKSVRKMLGKYPQFIDELHGTLPLNIQIANGGAVPAEHLRLELQTYGAATVMRQSDLAEDIKTAPAIADPPEAPRGMALGLHLSRALTQSQSWDLNPRLSALQQIPSVHRDRHAFYVVNDDEGRRRLAFECDEFRHGIGPTSLAFVLAAGDQLRHRARRNTLIIRATARNLPVPAAKSYVVRVEVTEGDSFARTKQWLTERFHPRAENS